MYLSTQFDYTYFLGQLGPTNVIATDITSMEVFVFPDWFESVRIEWSPSAAWAPFDPKYNVYRSESQEGNYELLTSSPISNNFLTSSENWNSSKFDNEWWIVEVILNNGSRLKTKPITSQAYRGTFQNNRAREINRREWVLLRKFSGMTASIMRRKKHGQRCPTCWDEVSKKVTVDHCPDCYGVGFTDGYFSGMVTKIQFDARIENQQYSYFGKFEANQIGAWTIAYPDIQPNDLLIRHGDLKIYRVEQIQNTELLGNPVRQIMRVTELSKDKIEYCLIDREGIRNNPIENGMDL